jgi:hypothetical protein
MDEATARATLVSYLGGASARPTLEAAEIDALLSRFRLADRYGVRPGGDGWEGTYALNAAAAEGWRMKGARVAGDFNFSADDASYSKGEVLAHCLSMEAKYAAMDRGVLYTDASGLDYRSDRLWP